MKKVNKLDIYTDGGCRPNPGTGAFASVLVLNGKVVMEKVEVKRNTTNSEMELMGFIQSITDLIMYIRTNQKDFEISFYIDSKYVINGVNKWMYNWEKNGWEKKGRGEIKHLELWKFIFDLIRQLKFLTNYEIFHVKAHKGNKFNTVVDNMCTQAIIKSTI